MTRIADLVIPEVWAPYIAQLSTQKSALWQSGLFQQNPEYDRIASGGGFTVNLPFFNDLPGDSEVLSDRRPLTPQGITASKDTAVILARGKAFNANILAGWASGTDPVEFITSRIADWWVRDLQKTAIAYLKGIFASATMTAEHTINVANETASSGATLNSDAVFDALALMGDFIGAVSLLFMHSKPFYDLQKQDLIETIQPSADLTIQTYKGMRVIVDDGLPTRPATKSGTIYTTYLAGQGAFAWGEANLPPDDAIETDRDILAGNDQIVSRRKFLMHPIGIRWLGVSITGDDYPNNTDLENGTNHERVFDRKNVRLLQITHN